MSIPIPGGILTTWAEPNDIKAWVGYTGSYYATKEAIPAAYRVEGMQVWAKESGYHKLYQLRGGIADGNYTEVLSMNSLTFGIIQAHSSNSNALDIHKQLRNVPEATTLDSATWQPDMDTGMVYHASVEQTMEVTQPQNGLEGARYTFILSFTGTYRVTFAETYWPKLGQIDGVNGDVYVIKAEYYNSKMYAAIQAYTTAQTLSGKYGTSADDYVPPTEINSGTSFTDDTPEQLELTWSNASPLYTWFWAPDTYVYSYVRLSIGSVVPISNNFNVTPVTVGTTDGYLYITKQATQLGTCVFLLDN